MTHKLPHKYKLIKIRRIGPSGKRTEMVKRVIYKCVLTDCPHYLNEPELAIGRLSLCAGGCGEAVKIGPDMPVNPMCENCKSKRRQSRQIA